MKEVRQKPQNYRGIKPVELVLVLEGDGTKENPYREVNYVVEHVQIMNSYRMRTIGKVIPLTAEEKSWFGDFRTT